MSYEYIQIRGYSDLGMLVVRISGLPEGRKMSRLNKIMRIFESACL